ncbi:RrF2 family transcriptional regulator [Hyphomicrobium sp. DY-1]|uniref:RrF2 family transcriptional regulator n=1 Tax=Hyphomicrobium sp. DY-1 TaxID=3075650 RepID=UPI0039C12CCB
MAHIGNGVEYALHCLLWIAAPLDHPPSSRDLAELQGVSPTFLAKIFQKLEKARIVEAMTGIRGGYRLARPPEKISVLDIVDAIEGRKALFDCQEIRARCVLFDGSAPAWATRGVCGIHAVMLRAEQVLRAELAQTSLASLSRGFIEKRLPNDFPEKVRGWFADRQTEREKARQMAMRAGQRKHIQVKSKRSRRET